MNWTEIIVSFLSAIITICLPIITKALIGYLKTKTDDARMLSVLTDVSASINTSFSVWKLAFDKAKEKLSADGTFDNTDLETAIKEAAKSAAGTLTVKTVAYLEMNGINLQSYLIDKIRARMGE